MPNNIDDYLGEQFKHGRLILFAGAGYSLAAYDLRGKRLPTGGKLAEELWELAYPGDPYDQSSTLQDLFEVSRQKSTRQLSDYLLKRLTVDPSKIPAFYKDWLTLPWRRIYTLNVDDLFQASADVFKLPRELDSINGLSWTGDFAKLRKPGGLEAIHLNGRIADGLDAVTFSAIQYAERSAGSEPLYHQLVTDIVAFPVVFVGTPLDEPLLWQYLELRGVRGPRGMRELRPRSFLVTPSIPRAKQDLLASYNVEIVTMTAEEFASHHLVGLSTTISVGLASLRESTSSHSSMPQVVRPAELGTARRSLFLLGAEPTFSDIQEGLAVTRTIDEELFLAVQANCRTHSRAPKLVVLGGTAGSGKSTSLMRLGLRLVSEGKLVGWVGRNDNVSPISLRRWVESQSEPVSLVLDDADRYGGESPRLLRALLDIPRLENLVVATRSAKLDQARSPRRLCVVGARSDA